MIPSDAHNTKRLDRVTPMVSFLLPTTTYLHHGHHCRVCLSVSYSTPSPPGTCDHAILLAHYGRIDLLKRENASLKADNVLLRFENDRLRSGTESPGASVIQHAFVVHMAALVGNALNSKKMAEDGMTEITKFAKLLENAADLISRDPPLASSTGLRKAVEEALVFDAVDQLDSVKADVIQAQEALADPVLEIDFGEIVNSVLDLLDKNPSGKSQKLKCKLVQLSVFAEVHGVLSAIGSCDADLKDDNEKLTVDFGLLQHEC